MNYLQNNQLSNQTTGMQQQSQQGSQAPKPGQDSYNPFDSGIQKAIASARESLGMNKQQQENAFNNSLLAFGDSMSQMPKEKGFLNNLGSIGRALSPALKTYDQSENAAMAENQAIANQILAYQKAEQARQAQEEDRAWHRQHAERQLGEQRRYHDLMTNSRGQSGLVELNGQNFRKLDGIEQRQANAYKKKASNTYLAVQNIDKAWEELEKLTEDNSFQPIGGYSEIANPVKDFFGKFGKKESLQKETASRKNLSTQLGRLNTSLEALTSGGGKLGQGMYDRLKPFFPDIKTDDYETVKTKVRQIKKESDLYYKAAKLSSDLGLSIEALDIEEMENKQLQGQQNLDQKTSPQDTSNIDVVEMQNANGRRFRVPKEKMQEFMDDPDEPLTIVGK
jgi:hypothetical protein